MGFLVDTQKEGGGHSWGCVRSLVRRKQVDSANVKAEGHHQLAKALTVPHLIAIGNLRIYCFFFSRHGQRKVFPWVFWSPRLKAVFVWLILELMWFVLTICVFWISEYIPFMEVIWLLFWCSNPSSLTAKFVYSIRRWSNNRSGSLYSCRNSCKRAFRTCSCFVISYCWNCRRTFCLLLCWTL